MAIYMKLGCKQKVQCLRKLINSHDEMMKNSIADTSVTQAVNEMITGYHRNKREEFKTELKKLIGVPDTVAMIIDVEVPLKIGTHFLN